MCRRVHHPWYNIPVTHPDPSPAPLRDVIHVHARLRVALARHLLVELDTLDPRTLDGAEHLTAARQVLAIRRDTLRAELDAHLRVLGVIEEWS